MNLRRTGVLVFLAVGVPTAEAGRGLNDPMLCYILDGVLLVYSLIVTGLYFREKFFKPKANSKDDNIYSGLSQPAQEYEDLRHRNDAEGGATATATRGNRREAGNETYTALKKVTEDDYKEIAVKKERRRNKPEQVYEGLKTATKDTYDSLQMQPLPPPR
ncbi:hypothetical protein AAFF_G00194210 [Aldrovandia affinis]|uniref:T-cell surface glycoprotein CD3 zeta chain n=1 Tax=Aldrovandia affinis TaxID=143900 RepID=A0AAD7WV98_9TELE|nr:hypothetical protein AAFF_G00194210 [Aldrovandia affinis]